MTLWKWQDSTRQPVKKLSGDYENIRAKLRLLGWDADKLERIDLTTKLSDNPWDTDKVLQGYMHVYEQLAKELGPEAKVCELGVWLGGSLATWQVLYPDGIVAGVDLWEKAGWPEGSVKLVMSQEDPKLAAKLREISPEWDLIIDDCSHEGKPTLTSFTNLWPLIRPGGYYVIEDWFYGWHKGQIDTEYNMVDLARDLLENLDGDGDVDEITYRYGMIVIHKGEGDWRPEKLVELRERFSNIGQTTVVRG